MRRLNDERVAKISRTVVLAGLFGAAVGLIFAVAWYRWSMDGESAPAQDAWTAQQLRVKAWRFLPDLPAELAQFETVFWEPTDTTSLREWLHQSTRVRGASVLEIGTGTGLIALVCRKLGAARVVATDINPAAVACGRYNADRLGLDEVEFRQVESDQPGAFAVVDPRERFDLIISNPPWEDAPVEEVAAHAFYDPDFALLDSLLADAGKHLQPDGYLLLAYGAKTAILRIQTRAPALGWKVKIVDERNLDELPEVFLPGMLLILTR